MLLLFYSIEHSTSSFIILILATKFFAMQIICDFWRLRMFQSMFKNNFRCNSKRSELGNCQSMFNLFERKSISQLNRVNKIDLPHDRHPIFSPFHTMKFLNDEFSFDSIINLQFIYAIPPWFDLVWYKNLQLYIWFHLKRLNFR